MISYTLSVSFLWCISVFDFHEYLCLWITKMIFFSFWAYDISRTGCSVLIDKLDAHQSPGTHVIYPQIWKMLKSILCKFGIVDKMGSFSLNKTWCQKPAEWTYWILFMRKYKGYEHNFPSWVVICIDPFGITIH